MTTPMSKCEDLPPQHSFMVYSDTEPVRTQVFNWVAENTQGAFDMDDPEVPTPNSGVSVRASDNKMHVSTYHQLYPVNDGDYVIEQRSVMAGTQFFVRNPEDFAANYRVTS